MYTHTCIYLDTCSVITAVPKPQAETMTTRFWQEDPPIPLSSLSPYTPSFLRPKQPCPPPPIQPRLRQIILLINLGIFNTVVRVRVQLQRVCCRCCISIRQTVAGKSWNYQNHTGSNHRGRNRTLPPQGQGYWLRCHWNLHQSRCQRRRWSILVSVPFPVSPTTPHPLLLQGPGRRSHMLQHVLLMFLPHLLCNSVLYSMSFFL